MRYDSKTLPDSVIRLLPPEYRARFVTPPPAHEAPADRSERELQGQIAQYLRLHGIPFCWPRSDKRSRITPGWPDFTLAIDGVPIAFEVKVGREEPTSEQAEVHRAMRDHGWRVEIVRSIEDVRRVVGGGIRGPWSCAPQPGEPGGD